jgi:dihydrofolate synthase / folylpolyglutamate synthase
MEVQAAYEDVLRYMYERLPMFSRIGKEAIKQDLDNIKAFCDALENLRITSSRYT